MVWGPLNLHLISEVTAGLRTSISPAVGYPIALGTKPEHLIIALRVLPVQPYFVPPSASFITKKMGTIKDRNGMDLTEAEDIR